jgi:TadE-like protein
MRAQRGQSTVELLLVIPVVLLLMFGVYTAAGFISDRQIAGQAVRAGARLGAELGGNQFHTGQAAYPSTCMATGTDPCIVDNAMVTSVVTIARGLSNVASIDEIDIYEPCAIAGGTCSASTQSCPTTLAGLDGRLQANDPVDVFKPNALGKWVLSQPAGATQYTLDLRRQNHPSESLIAVRLAYTFKASAPMSFFDLQTAEYAAMCLAPNASGG